MSIRSTDMQVLIQKVGDVAKLQQIQQHEVNIKQQEFNSQIMDQTSKITHTINQTLRDESALVHEKQEKEEKAKKNKNNKGNSDNKENSKEHTKNLEPGRGDKLDIIV
ncbi:MAG: hypothetical protein CVU90_06305 [Firmicutes bacterium HGW-Firmicutes-15]|nr:MAG: hypothetical protein CVU90_06305 [Firmicutes bacterium HGW-Firmicutes-15]